MTVITEEASGLQFVELSHPFGHGIPVLPGDDDILIWKSVYHARDGVQSQKLSMNMHCSTHMTAPVHLLQGGQYVADLPLDLFFGNGHVLDIPKGKWELISAADLDAAGPAVVQGDIVIIRTGWHTRYADSLEYFGDAPGLGEDAADWLIERGVKLVGIDNATIDHPLATNLGVHRGGPRMRYLPGEYQAQTGRDPKVAFPHRNPAHRKLLAAGIPTISNVGGDIAEIAGKTATFHAVPWKWIEGDACIIRLMAILDPHGSYRIEKGDKQ